MANNLPNLLLLLLLSALYLVAAQQRNFNISRGSSLTPTGNSSWLSPSGLYAFGFYQQGNGYAVGIFLSGIPQKTVVWTANRDNPPVSDNVTLQLSADGKLILQQLPQGEATNVVADVPQSIFSASMLDSGNFVLYNSSMERIWQSFEHPTDTLLPTQHLPNNQELLSSISTTNHSQGIFKLAMQGDGNLVSYLREDQRVETAYYALQITYGKGSTLTLNLDDDGSLYLINATKFTWNLTNGFSKKQKLYLMRLDADGIFRVYSYDLDRKSDWSVEWSSSNDKCVGRGLCRLNAFCTPNDDNEAKCVCLPGFDYVSQGSRSSGCERNYTSGSCKNEDGSIEYSMRLLENIQWENTPYYVLKSPSRDDCKTACLEDCNCEAALFVGQECRKQRLPLRYGRRPSTDSSITFVKVGSAKSVVPKSPKESKKELRFDILIVSVSLLALAFMVFVISVILVVYKNKIWAYKKISENVELMEDVAPRAFTYEELEKVTSNFQEELGRGASGTVYKGTLQNNQKLVAVKRLEKVLTERDREFQNEMKVIGRTHHRNLVRLLGYSLDGPNKLLVYEYMLNGSLADILFTPEFRLRWDERISIALDIARGILYLHEECETQIIHCDIKPKNILMDENRSAKIFDFGLAKLLKPDQTNTYTGIRGTRGYVAPEWHRNMPITVKVDVYSFGIVLLEIICCRRNLDMSLPEDECVFEEWVYQCFENRELHKLVGDEELDKKKLDRMVRVSLWCILDDPSLRPSVKKVLLMLEGTVDIPVPPSPTSFLSAI